LISFIPKSARSEYPSREFLVPSIQNSNTDMPVCYMQTVAGRTLNSAVCVENNLLSLLLFALKLLIQSAEPWLSLAVTTLFV
jgi:hypothetical protein